MSFPNVSQEEILRVLIANQGASVIPPQGTAVQQVANSALLDPQGLGRRMGPDPTRYVAQTDNYRIDPRGNRVGDVMLDAATGYGELSGQFYDAVDPKIKSAQKVINKGVTKVGGTGARRAAGKAGAALGALPGMSKLGAAARVLGPAVGAVGGGLAVADLVTGEESGINKTMDATAMGVGGTIGGIVGLGNPLAISAGVGLGKMVSDGTQWLFGDKKTPEQRKMELALAQLQSRGLV